jgi:hypothetical protein
MGIDPQQLINRQAWVAALAAWVAGLESVLDVGDVSSAGVDGPAGRLEQFLAGDDLDDRSDGLKGAVDESAHDRLRALFMVYQNTLPGGPAGDRRRAAEQHALRLAWWRGDAQLIDEHEIEALGLEEESAGDGHACR